MPRKPIREYVTYRGERYFLGSTGYYEASRGRAAVGHRMLHRAIWTDAHGPIPDGHHIHHIDGNPTNNDLANLECLPAGAHIAKHARNRPPHTAEAKARIGDANRKHWAERKPRDITCAVCGTVFQSTGTRAKFCSTSCATKDRHRRTYVPGKGYRRRDGTYSPRP